MMQRVLVFILLVTLLTALCSIAGAQQFPNRPPDTSRQALTPQWAFEVWMWEDNVNTAAAVWDMVDGCVRRDLPVRAVIIDSPWATAYNNFVWDEQRYPEPQRLIDDLHARGIRLVMWMTCMINPSTQRADARGSKEDLYAIAKEKGYLANGGQTTRWWKGDGGFIDYTNPEAAKWWHGLMDRVLLMGVDGWKVDGAGELFPLSGGYGKAGPIAAADYVDMYYRDTYQHLMRRNPEGVTMTRSADTEETGYTRCIAPKDAAPVTWFGDQLHTWGPKGMLDAIDDQFCAMDAHYAVMGADIGGYESPPDRVIPIPRHLYLRWFQWSTFLPFFLNGGGDEHRPWKFGEGVLDVYRKFAWTHQELAPYFYSQVHEAHDGRRQFMKPGPGTYEYTLGDQFLVAIMDKDQTKRSVTFPAGDWIDYFDNSKVYRGPREVEVRVPLDRYPVFIRSGSIIPLNVVNRHAGHGDQSSIGSVTLDIYPDAKRAATFSLWDESSGKTDLECAVKNVVTRVIIRGAAARSYVLRVRTAKRPREVRLAVARKPARFQKLDGTRWMAGDVGWRYDAVDKRLWVRLRTMGDAEATIVPAEM